MKLAIALGLVFTAATVTPSTAQQPSIVDDAAIKAILANRIDVERRNVGIVVGVIEPAGARIVSHGTVSIRDKRNLDGDSVFEIGSITKVFTALLLADMVERGEVKLDDPIAKYLPPTVRVPERDGKSITLQDISTHSSGLPRMPQNFRPANPANPYADYTVAQLYEFISGYTLPRAIGERFEYSNLAVGLLGHALALKVGVDYETLIRDRVLSRLKMTDTSITLNSAQQERLARGHNAQLEPAANWDVPTFAGAGALRSTVKDMMKFLAAFTGGESAGLSPAIARMRSIERPGPAPGTVVGLGWIVLKRPDLEIVWHNGGTGGYRSFIGYVPSRKTGVVVLSNMAADAPGVDDIGLHLLDPRLPLNKPPAPRTRITLPAAALQSFVGRYELMPGFIATVTQEGERLFVQPSNQPRHEIFPEGPRSFFATIVDAQFVFEVDATGRASSMTLHQGAQQLVGKRLPE